jgi:hypothetical protein
VKKRRVELHLCIRTSLRTSKRENSIVSFPFSRLEQEEEKQDTHLWRAQRVVPRELEFGLEDAAFEGGVLCAVHNNNGEPLALSEGERGEGRVGGWDAPGPEIRQDQVKKSSSLTGPVGA